MGGEYGVVEVERRLLLGSSSREATGTDEDDAILYNASFEDMEENYVKYHTANWVIYSLLLVVAWGFGFLMLLYIPVLRYVLRKEFRSRRLYVTPNAIVYKVTKPVPFPCFGSTKKDKHVLLPSVADIIIQQGYLQSFFGIYAIRIENLGVRRPASDDVHIEGIANPRTFRKVVLTRLHSMRGKRLTAQFATEEDTVGQPTCTWMPSLNLAKSFAENDYLHHEELILQKLEEVGNHVKNVQNLMEKKRSSQVPESVA